MPLPDARAFEACVERREDGVGTYFELGPYRRTLDALTREGVPQGTVEELELADSAVYPGTRRAYWIYVPAQYDGETPAGLLVLTDGGVYVNNGLGAPYRTPTVMDNLIAEGAMPVTIGVFVDPGRFEDGTSNRSVEYDTPDDTYARFVHDDLLPLVTARYSITDDPTRRAIGGRSSGAVAAFGVVWFRTDSFRLAYTTIGSFVRLRANPDGDFADAFPGWIDAAPRLPIRVTLLSGQRDNDNEFGNWREAHMAMTTALDCAGYTYRAGFGEASHGDFSHINDRFGEDLRWLFWGAAD